MLTQFSFLGELSLTRVAPVLSIR